MRFDELDPQANKHYEAVNIRMGFSPDFTSPVSFDSKKGTPLILSSDPSESTVPAQIILVHQIAELKKIVGIPDHIQDDHLEAMEAPEDRLVQHFANSSNARALQSGLTEADIKTIRKAATSYVLGNSERVKTYERMINALLFPTQIAYFASTDDLIIRDQLVVKGGLVLLNFINIIIEPGGSFNSQCEDLKIDCVNFKTGVSTLRNAVSEGLEAATDYPINISVADYKDPAQHGTDAGVGTQGQQGADAVEYQSPVGANGPWHCTSDAQAGKQGGTGGDGTPGSPGGTGPDQGTFTLIVKDAITGDFIVNAGGGNGQEGGRGGNGGPGGPPGAVGVHSACKNPSKDNGPQGPGGKGAKGGKGGDGGDGNLVTIYYTSIQGGIYPKDVVGKPGKVGAGGLGGDGNPAGGSDGVGDPGSPSKQGVIWNIKPLPPGLL